MADEFDKIAFGDEAQAVLNNRAFQRAMETLREDAIAEITKIDCEKRDEHAATLRSIENLRAELQSIVTTGKNAQNRQG